jgi:hypothetical protein
MHIIDFCFTADNWVIALSGNYYLLQEGLNLDLAGEEGLQIPADFPITDHAI